MTEVTVNVEASDEQVVNALEQWVVQNPRRLGWLAHQALVDGRAVGVPIHGQRGVGVGSAAIPEQAERALEGQRKGQVSGLAPRLEVAVFELQIVSVAAHELQGVFHLARLCEVVGKLVDVGAVGGERRIGIEEYDPEAVLDHVQGDLAATDGALDEALDEEASVLQEEAVAGG